ncbi:Uncharacterised protein [Klebsiella michiganensis]|nr:Uncharacterised protein [Klebsiella michiganensis]
MQRVTGFMDAAAFSAICAIDNRERHCRRNNGGKDRAT